MVKVAEPKTMNRKPEDKTMVRCGSLFSQVLDILGLQQNLWVKNE